MRTTSGAHGGAAPLHPDDTLTRLRGVGPKTAAAMADEGFCRVLDLLMHLPRRYEDRTRVTSLDAIPGVGEWVLIRGRVSEPKVRRVARRRLTMTQALIVDGSGSLPVTWFNQPWIANRLDGKREFFIYGQVRDRRGGGRQLVNPEIEDTGEDGARVVPVYPKVARFGGRRLRRLIEQTLVAVEAVEDPLPRDILERFALSDLQSALRTLHAPEVGAGGGDHSGFIWSLNAHTSPAHRRLAFDELLAFACGGAVVRRRRARHDARAVDPAVLAWAQEGRVLPFELTAAQRRALEEIAADIGRDRPMGRLLQGDVGSGKTAVAALALLMVVEAGLQGAFMVPTELLAEQHLATLESYLGPAGVKPALLTSSLPPADRRSVLAGLRDGSVSLVVGTHALFQDAVKYHRLGLAVIDEQHRFGVRQRLALAAKGPQPHVLVMTATPIPRSLALTVYGDLDISVIDELPPGRRPVRTVMRPLAARPRVLDFVKDEVEHGGRAFVVFPFIEPSEESSGAALEELEAEIRRHLPGVAVGVIHGRMGRDRQLKAASGYRDGSIQVLLSTTIVEVGVDVPEATVMVVESAERFGLSQLHQLRGRVGRGERPAWCVLLADVDENEPARRRLEVLCTSHDGFEIAEADLAIRGPGELAGTRQWGGTGFRFAALDSDSDLIEATRDLASEMAAEGNVERIYDRLLRFHPVDRARGSA